MADLHVLKSGTKILQGIAQINLTLPALKEINRALNASRPVMNDEEWGSER